MDIFLENANYVFWISYLIILLVGLRSIRKGWDKILFAKKSEWTNKNDIFAGGALIFLGISMFWIAILVFLELPHLFGGHIKLQ